MKDRISDARLKQPCPIKHSFFMARQNAGDAYAKAVAELAHNLGAGSYVEYATLRLAAQAARKLSRKARADLEKQIRDHGCDDAA